MSSASRSMPTRLVVTAAAVVCCLLALALVPRSEGHFVRSLWTYPHCPGTPTDPQNVAWYGPGATVARSVELVEQRLGWRGESGSKQYFRSHGRCIEMSEQRNLGFRDKHHTRFFKMPGRDRKNRLWVFGDAHRERKKFCGFSKPISDAVYEEVNGVSGFDQGQREVYAGFSDLYRGYLYVPNRRTFKQCTDERVSWNGVTYLFYVR